MLVFLPGLLLPLRILEAVMTNSALATAHTNVALVKYWGKQDLEKNIPATSSLSMTLDGLWTRTRVTFDESLESDLVLLNGQRAEEKVSLRVSGFVDMVRVMAKTNCRVSVETENNFPTAGGLASSASGFAALCAASTAAAGLDLGLQQWASWARQGSGSAPRSLLGGFVALNLKKAESGQDCVVQQVAAAGHWDVCMVIALCADGPKKVGSTAGMERSKRTSPYYQGWLDSHDLDMQEARSALERRDLDALGRVAERSCFKMHALAMSSDPPLIYFKGATLNAIERVWQLREDGLAGWVTIDAGPHVKVFCEAENAKDFAEQLAKVPGVQKVMIAPVGPGVKVGQ